MYEWNSLHPALAPLTPDPEAVCHLLMERGFEYVEIAIPIGKYLFPVEDDVEFLIESYLELEDMYVGKEEIARCILGDGGLQISWKRDSEAILTDMMVMPHLDGRFAHVMTIRMDPEKFIQAWRHLIKELVDYAE